MVGWTELYFFELVLMRMSGFVLFNPILGRSNIPGYVKAGVILVLSVFVYSLGEGAVAQPPGTLAELAVIMLLELAVGFVLGFLMHLSNAVVHVGGEVIDAQMGLSMAQTYDAGSQINMTITGSLLNVLFVLNFFLENGHYTLMRVLLTSAEVLPYGSLKLNLSESGSATSESRMQRTVGLVEDSCSHTTDLSLPMTSMWSTFKVSTPFSS